MIELTEFITKEDLDEIRKKSIIQLHKMVSDFDEKNLKLMWIYNGSIPVFYTENYY